MSLVEIKHPNLEQTALVPEEALGHWARAGWELVEQDTPAAAEPSVTSATKQPVPAEATEGGSEPGDDTSSEPDVPAEESQPRRRRRTT